MPDDAPPIACDPSAIHEDEHDAHRRAAERVFRAVDCVRELPSGYAFQLPASPDILAQVGTFVARERLCCPFFQFTVEVPPNHDPVWLKLTGRKGVKAYVEDSVLPYWDLESTA